MTTDETGRLWTLPGWPSRFEYLGGATGTLGILGLPGHIRSLGLPEMVPGGGEQERVLHGAPVLHLGERAGSIFLAEKERGWEFTREDEETLALFASRAAMANDLQGCARVPMLLHRHRAG